MRYVGKRNSGTLFNLSPFVPPLPRLRWFDFLQDEPSGQVAHHPELVEGRDFQLAKERGISKIHRRGSEVKMLMPSSRTNLELDKSLWFSYT